MIDFLLQAVLVFPQSGMKPVHPGCAAICQGKKW
jgi:hypothetical protein